MSIVSQRAATAWVAAIWSALALIPLCAQATEFGGVVNASTNPGFVELSREFQTAGDLTWLRTSSASLARQGFNQVAIVPLPASPGKGPRSERLTADLWKVYWQCRTNLPVFPSVRQAWEVGNEPDFFWIEDNPDRMAAVVKAAYWGIKAGNPAATVLLPSMAFTPDKYQRELAANGVYPFLDGYNFHYYGYAQDFWPSLDLHRQFMAREGWDLPIWITEAGDFQFHQDRNTEPEDLARQQAFHERLAITAFTAGVDYYLPFILTPWIEEGSDLSLVTADFVPRPALESYLFLSRYLRGCRPCYQIWHQPTRSEIGVVLVQPDGNWLTALWTPYRWKDFELPTEEQRPRNRSSAGRRPPAAPLADLTTARRGGAALPGSWSRSTVEGPRGAIQPSADGNLPSVPQPSTAGQDSPIDPTALGLDFSFPPEIGWVTIGLRGALTLTDLPTASFSVSAIRNLFLRTPPHRFEISDCDWVPIGTESGDGGRKVEGRREGIADIRLPIGDLAIPGHSIKLQPASRTAHRPPSPVVLQLLYDPFAIAVDKPSQTYRFNPRLPILARLEIYNFSMTPQTGQWWPDLPEGWRVKLMGDQLVGHRGGLPGRTDAPVAARSRKLRSRKLQLAPGPGAREEASERLAFRAAIPPLSKLDLAIELIPPGSRTGTWDERPGVRSGSTTGQPRMNTNFLEQRARVGFNWLGRDGLGDVCSTRLEADETMSSPNLALPISGWCPAPEHPAQWDISSVDRDTVRLSLREAPEPGRNASAWLMISDNLELRASDVLRLQLRLQPSRPGTYFRVNFVTPTREMFRYTEDQPFGNYWTEWSSRLGDFGGTFWSHVGGECGVPVGQFRYLRLSFQGLVPGEAVEICNVGIRR